MKKHSIASSFSFLLLSLTHTSFAFFFGNTNGGGCSCSSCPSYPPCPPPPNCYAALSDCNTIQAPSYPSIQDCCATCPTPCRIKHVRQIFSQKRHKRQDDNSVEDEEEINTIEDNDAVVMFPSANLVAEEIDAIPNDLKCNSERLRNLIVMSKGKDITIIKRNIQLLAEKQFNHKYNIICSADGDFSYITNTDEYCQEYVNGNTCYIFKQTKRIVFSNRYNS